MPHMQGARSVYQVGAAAAANMEIYLGSWSLMIISIICKREILTSKIPNHNNKHVLWIPHMQGARSVYQVGAAAAANMEIYI